MRDEELRDALEADFQQYYGTDLRDLYRVNSRLTLRRAVVFTATLPGESRVMRIVRNDVLDQKEHLLLTLSDYLQSIDFSTQVAARAAVDADNASIFDQMPVPMDRPKLRTIEEIFEAEVVEDELPPFTTGRELAANFGVDGITVKKIKKSIREIQAHREES